MKKKAADATIRIFVLVVLAVVLQGCSATKFVPEGDSLYVGSDINFEPQGNIRRIGALEEDLNELIYPKPNKKILGMRPGVWFYYKAGEPKKKKGFRYFVRNKLGREPVLLKD